MMRDVKWSQVLIAGLTAVVVLTLGFGVLLVLLGGGHGMLGRGMMRRGGPGDGWCPWCGGAAPLGGRFMGALAATLACLFPLGALVLLAVAGILLVGGFGGSAPSRDGPDACPSCGASVRPGWKVCPQCAEPLDDEG